MKTDAPSAVAPEPTGRPAWGSLPRRAAAFRIAHIVWGIVELGALTHVWGSALTRHRDRYLRASMMLLLVQGVALVAGRGNCPFGPFQRQLGDPVPMFELVLPPRAAKAAIPVLFVVAVAGMVAVLARPPSRRRDAAGRVAMASIRGGGGSVEAGSAEPGPRTGG